MTPRFPVPWMARLRRQAGLLPVVLGAACGAGAEPPEPAEVLEPPLRLVDIQSAEFPSDLVGDGRVRLVGGKYQGEGEVTIQMSEAVAFGATTEGRSVAAVVLTTTTGGTGSFSWLYLVGRSGGSAGPIAEAFLGDRVEIRELGFRADTIQVKLVTQGPEDALCCPTLQVEQRYVREGGALRRVGE